MSEEPVIRQFAILAYDPTKPIPRRSRNHIMGSVYTKGELEKKLDQYTSISRPSIVARVVELVPITTDIRKVTVTKEVIL